VLVVAGAMHCLDRKGAVVFHHATHRGHALAEMPEDAGGRWNALADRYANLFFSKSIADTNVHCTLPESVALTQLCFILEAMLTGYKRTSKYCLRLM
jgi:hypothetical protein